jgi:hypothetical protein
MSGTQPKTIRQKQFTPIKGQVGAYSNKKIRDRKSSFLHICIMDKLIDDCQIMTGTENIISINDQHCTLRNVKTRCTQGFLRLVQDMSQLVYVDLKG